MSPSVALLVFIVGIAGLFFFDRDSSARSLRAVWLPVIWLWIYGSRSISSWLGVSTLNDSPIDELVAAVLLVLGIIVLIRRRNIALLLKLSWPVVLYFSFCLLSLLWSDFPGHGFTRWIKALGDLVMVMVLATETQLDAALRRFFSRVGFILLPFSVLLIKYYPNLGRGYDEWGFETNTGVTNNKNLLGVVIFILALGTVWQILELLRDRKRPNRTRRLIAQSTLLGFGVSLLFTAHSATSGACFTLGAAFMVSTALPLFRRRPAAVHAIVLAMLLGGGLTVLLGGKAAAAQVVGRDATFTGRTDVWALVIPMAPNPLVGAGFENFWFGLRLTNLRNIYHPINEAHNGYIEVYLNLGFVGVGLIALILIYGYRRAVGAFRRDSALGSLLVAYILTAAIYSVTEAGFRMLSPIWFCLILSMVAASRLSAANGFLTADKTPGAMTGNADAWKAVRAASFDRAALNYRAEIDGVYSRPSKWPRTESLERQRR
jgi:exopolysaccharide production protein ExoQ